MRSKTFSLVQVFFFIVTFFMVASLYQTPRAHAVTVAHECAGGGYGLFCDPVSQDSQNLQQTGGGGSQNLPQTGGGADSSTWETGDDSTGGKASIVNPLGFDSITEVLLAILDVLVIFMIPIIILFIIYAGFLYVTARGNQSTIETAHRTLAYAVVGGLLVLGARALLAVIEGTVNQLL